MNGFVHREITLADWLTGTSSATAGRPEVVARYLTTHYSGGRVLADEASGAPLIFASGLDLSAFTTIGYHPYYENAVAEPAGNVGWVVVYDVDAIDGDVHLHPDRFHGSTVVVHQERARLLGRVTTPSP